MLDFFVAVGVALIGLAVVCFMFHTINKSDVVAISTARDRKSRPRKSAKPPRPHDVPPLDRGTEALIAREIARHTASLRPDTRVVHATTLEALQKDAARRQKSGAEVSSPIAPPPATEARQELIDKELGFQRVERQRKGRKPAPQAAPLSQDEEMDRKLGQFFRSSNRRDKKFKLSVKDEPTSPSGGAQVVVKKDISNARTW